MPPVVWQRTHIISAQTFEFTPADWGEGARDAHPRPRPLPQAGEGAQSTTSRATAPMRGKTVVRKP